MKKYLPAFLLIPLIIGVGWSYWKASDKFGFAWKSKEKYEEDLMADLSDYQPRDIISIPEGKTPQSVSNYCHFDFGRILKMASLDGTLLRPMPAVKQAKFARQNRPETYNFPNVKLEDNRHYVRLDHLDAGAYASMIAIFESERTPFSPIDLILDLRACNGESLFDLEQLIDQLVPTKKTDLYTISRNGHKKTIKSTGKRFYNFQNIVLLVDHGTRGTALALAQVLKNHVPCTLMGDLPSESPVLIKNLSFEKIGSKALVLDEISFIQPETATESKIILVEGWDMQGTLSELAQGRRAFSTPSGKFIREKLMSEDISASSLREDPYLLKL